MKLTHVLDFFVVSFLVNDDEKRRLRIKVMKPPMCG